jgi:hypothetical protein
LLQRVSTREACVAVSPPTLLANRGGSMSGERPGGLFETETLKSSEAYGERQTPAGNEPYRCGRLWIDLRRVQVLKLNEARQPFRSRRVT